MSVSLVTVSEAYSRRVGLRDFDAICHPDSAKQIVCTVDRLCTTLPLRKYR